MSSKVDTNFSSIDFVERVKCRDAHAIEQLVRSYTEPLLKASLGLGFDRQTSDELVQRVWSTFFEVAPKFQGKSHLRTFLFGILYKKASELRREEVKIGKTDSIDEVVNSRFSEDGHWIRPPMEPEQFHAGSQMLDMIIKCIDVLPLIQRMAFCLKEIEEQKSSEICKILEVSVTHLGVLIFRARNRLRECIEKKA